MGKSLQEVNLDESYLRRRNWQNRLKPPYMCPVCFIDHTVHVKKESFLQTIVTGSKKETIRKYRFYIYCQNACFLTSFTYTSELYGPIDVYCNIVDDILKEKEMNNPRQMKLLISP